MSAKDLIENGYEKFGNWYVKGIISVNMFTKEIKSNSNIIFRYTFDNKMTIAKCNQIYELLSNL
jgi:hypothetical protein